MRAAVKRFIGRLNDFALVVWVCRVSAISVAIGFLLNGCVPQVRDLFNDVPSATGPYYYLEAVWNAVATYFAVPTARDWWRYVAIMWHAVIVALCVFLLWAFPVFHAARKALADTKGSPAQLHGADAQRFAPFVERVPRALGALCFAAVLTGLVSLLVDLPGLVSYANLQVYAHAAATAIAGVLFYVVAISRTEEAKRTDKEADRPAEAAKRTAEEAERPSGEAELPSGEVEPTIAADVAKPTTAGDVVKPITAGDLVKPTTATEVAKPMTVRDVVKQATVDDVANWVGAASVVVVGLIFTWVLFFPEYRPGLDRATLLPLVLGAWVPLLGWMGRWSYRTRVPAVVLFVVAVTIIARWAGDGHEIRLTPPESNAVVQARQGIRTQWTLDYAAHQWAQANGCTLKGVADVKDGVPESGPDCPRPIIVAAAGGASRAAFITATTLGTLLDVTCESPTAEKGRLACRGRPLFAKRLFAISGVSGGSLGAALYSAALDAAVEDSVYSEVLAPPCKSDASAQSVWFRDTYPGTWRDCLQAIAAGDFLSATALGVAISDPVPLSRWLGFGDTNRAALLESAWTTWFDTVVGSRGTSVMKRPFASIGPRANDWRPLLVLNGTSSTTGRRILTSHIFPWYWPSHDDGAGAERARLFRDSYDIRELYERPFLTEPPQCAQFISAYPFPIGTSAFADRDFTVAAAITNSARFPLISPPGKISCDSADGTRKVVDRVVDGGYFENFGATTALDIARALEQMFKIKPLVLIISNDPLDAHAADYMLDDACPPLWPDEATEPWLGALSVPAGALYRTGDARGAYAVRELSSVLRAHDAPWIPCGKKDTALQRVFHVTIHGEADPKGGLKSVSMSWWLSKTVQEFIDTQVPGIHPFPKTESKNLFDGRLRNLVHIMALCDAIGAKEECQTALPDPESLRFLATARQQGAATKN
jgi:hypothetical protein